MHLGLTVKLTALVAPFYEEARGLARWLAETPMAEFRPFEAVFDPREKGVTLLSSKNQTQIISSSAALGFAVTGRFATRGGLSSKIGQGSCQRSDAAQRPSSAILVSFVIGSHPMIAFAYSLFQVVASSFGGEGYHDAHIPDGRHRSHEVKGERSRDTTVSVSDRVQITKSVRDWATRLDLRGGEFGEVERIEGGRMTVRMDGGGAGQLRRSRASGVGSRLCISSKIATGRRPGASFRSGTISVSKKSARGSALRRPRGVRVDGKSGAFSSR
ncbi:hypothetical protein ASG54_22375 [Aureimonas sp. Leaf460]|nr:hypothetical protein ASG62_25165 [Aureimonas sp. Leaf427]KQT68652.1 hypothetical protein ASG54_22375 [Aureimonas sp. Leaf460]